jgi:hypothetical protein
MEHCALRFLCTHVSCTGFHQPTKRNRCEVLHTKIPYNMLVHELGKDYEGPENVLCPEGAHALNQNVSSFWSGFV